VAEPFLVFLPFARRGMAAAVTAPADDLNGNPLGRHPMVDVKLLLESEVGQVEVPSGQRMLDSGGVTGIDPAVVLRTDPGPGSTDFEPANMASVELRVPDLPWMFTPAAPSGQPPKLRPWLALVVVERDEAGWQPSARPLPRLSVHVDALPDHRDLWAWAHVQCALSGDPGAPLGEAALQAAPALSRLVCARHLEPGRAYLACLVPTFEAGRLAGLSQPVADDPQTRTRPAWTTGSGRTVELPVYYSWQFTTAPEATAADFEELASRLRPATPEECRQLQPAPVDVTNPLGQVPPPPRPQTLRLATALRFAGDLEDDGTELAGWDPAVRESFRARLRTLLEVPAGQVEPVVAPPIYGGNHLGVDRVAPPPWVEQLNLDARFRIAAGLGAQYVREEQERLMQRAWEQLDAVNARRHLRRMAELAMTVGQRLHDRHVTGFSDERLARFAAPAAARFPLALEPAGVATLAGAVQQTSLPDAAFSAAFAKLARPQGTVARRFARGTGGLTVLANGLRNAVAPPVVEVAAAPSVLFAPTGPPPAQNLPPSDGLTVLAAQSDAFIQPLHSTAGLPSPPPGLLGSPSPPVAVLAGHLEAEVPLAGTLRAGTDPVVATLGRFAARGGDPRDLAGPAPAAVPAELEFPAPMAAVLASSHPDWLLPGLSSVPDDRVVLLETNRRWVEAFLVGLNHELNRELLWREYPGDLRGSAFTRFWPRHDQAPDIKPLATWTDSTQLGGHNPAAGLGPASQVVLLVRGGLLRRFPGVTLYARPAVVVERDGFRFHDERPGTEPIRHDFALHLGEGTVAFGFPIAESVALGQDPNGAGVVFVFEQPPHQHRFGLDATPTAGGPFWDNVTWAQVKGPPRPNGAVFADARRDLQQPPVRWGLGADAAGFAYATFQRPVKMVFHATDLILGPRPIGDPHHDTAEQVIARFVAAFGQHSLLEGLL
jgi:hypothetical protein